MMSADSRLVSRSFMLLLALVSLVRSASEPDYDCAADCHTDFYDSCGANVTISEWDEEACVEHADYLDKTKSECNDIYKVFSCKVQPCRARRRS